MSACEHTSREGRGQIFQGHVSDLPMNCETWFQGFLRFEFTLNSILSSHDTRSVRGRTLRSIIGSRDNASRDKPYRVRMLTLHQGVIPIALRKRETLGSRHC